MNENTKEEKSIDDIESSEELKKEMLKPTTKAKSETDKEIEELEVENSGGGIGGSGG